VLAAAAVPAGVSDEITPAPARPVTRYRDATVVIEDGKFQEIEKRYRAGGPGRERDVFDVMAEQAARRGGKLWLDQRMIEIARDYRDLFERVESAGFVASFKPDAPFGGQGRGDFMDAYLRDKARLDRFHRAIGDGVAKKAKGKVQTSSGGRVRVSSYDLARIGRKPITVRGLVDNVCIAQQPLSACLEGYGWSASTKNRETLQAALCAALARMDGI
jgi:hypothetical protein